MAKKSMSSGEESINHYGLVRLRVEGSGFLRLRFLSLSEVREDILAPITLVDSNDVEPTRLSNFTQQRAQLEIKTTNIDEVFHCSKIVIFAKSVAASYPG